MSYFSVILFKETSFFQSKSGYDELAIETRSNSPMNIDFQGYIPSSDNTLTPHIIKVSNKGNLYENLITALINSSREYYAKDAQVVSVVRERSLIRIKLSSGFRSDITVDEEKLNLVLMSIVNTVTEITGIDKVEIFSDGNRIKCKGVDTFKRDVKHINIKVFASPSEALREQMDTEKGGDFFKAYNLMSPIKTSHRKMLHEYIKEMEEIKSIGFLSGGYKIKNTSINGNEAVVEVEFINKGPSGEVVGSSIVPIKCILINKGWVVAW
ncbi:MAG: GerMN domain-containing protein [Clostridium sp.]|uniref:GerMN domain-containing protein n=2 Tax=Clostridium sp. TaxID=1506 RepID=UPI002FCAC59F